MKKCNVLVLFFMLFFIQLFGTISVHAASTMDAYNVALKEYNQAVENLKAEQVKCPNWTIDGEIIVREKGYIIVWGSADSNQAPDWHEGWSADSTNIKILNPNLKGIQNGYYNSSGHYYKYDTTGEGRFGQTVSIKVFGAAPKSESTKLTTLSQKVATAKVKLDKLARDTAPSITIKYNGKTYKNNDTIPVKDLMDKVSFTALNLGVNKIDWYIKNGNTWKKLSSGLDFSYEVGTVAPIEIKAVKNSNANLATIVKVNITTRYKVNMSNEYTSFLDYTVKNALPVIPLQEFCDFYGMDIKESADGKAFSAASELYSVECKVGEKTAVINGKEVSLSQEIQVADKKWLVSVDILKPLNMTYDWIPEINSLNIFESEDVNDVYRIGYLSNEKRLYKGNPYFFDLAKTSLGATDILGVINNRIYYLNNKNLYSCSLDLKDEKRILKDSKTVENTLATPYGIFYIDSGRLYGVDLNGQNQKTVIDSSTSSDELLDVDSAFYSNNYLYVKCLFSSDLYRIIDLRTNNIVSINRKSIDAEDGTHLIKTFDGNDLIYSNETGTIFRLTNNQSSVICKTNRDVTNIEVAGDYIYYVADEKTYRVNKNGGTETLIYDNKAKNFKTYGNWIYFIASGSSFNGELVRMSIENPKIFCKNEEINGDYDIVNDYIYSDDTRIRSNLSPKTVIELDTNRGLYDFYVLPY